MINASISGDAWTDISIPLPRLRGDGVFRIKSPSAIRCGAPRVLLEGTPLAIEVRRRDENVTEVAAGPLEGGTLVLAVRATPPVTVSSQALTVECEGSPPVLVALALTGEVRFVEGRSGWIAPKTVHYGDIVEARLTLRNDGTVDMNGGRVAIGLPFGVVPAFKADTREVDIEGGRVLLIELPALAVRESVEIKAPVSITDPNVAAVTLRARVLDGDGGAVASFDSDPIAITHKGAASVVMHLIDGERLRYGDDVRVQVNIVQAGQPLPDTRLAVEGTYIQPINLDLGPLQHGERRTIPLRLRLRDVSASELWDDRVFVRLHSSAMDQAACYNIELPCCGKPLLRMQAQVSAADETGAHRVDVLLENRGDGVAPAPRIRFERVGEVRAVVDSLRVDGAAVYEVDGSVPIFDAGIVLRDIGLGQRRVVSFAIRSPKALKADLRGVAFAGSVQAECVVYVDLLAAANRNAGTYQGEDAIADFPVIDSVLNMPGREPERLSKSDEAPSLLYPSEWTDIGREYLDDGQVALGRHVLALLSWLPRGAAGDEQWDVAARRLTEEVQRTQLLGQAPLRGGFWGVSGVSIATDGVRTASEAFAKARGQEYPGGGQLTALRWLSVQVSVPEHLKEWQQAVVNALLNADSDEALTDLMSFTVLDEAA